MTIHIYRGNNVNNLLLIGSLEVDLPVNVSEFMGIIYRFAEHNNIYDLRNLYISDCDIEEVKSTDEIVFSNKINKKGTPKMKFEKEILNEVRSILDNKIKMNDILEWTFNKETRNKGLRENEISIDCPLTGVFCAIRKTRKEN